MATITGTIKLSSDEVAVLGMTFVPLDTPQVLGTTVYVAQETRVQLSTTGTFSVVLAEGDYTVKVDNGEQFDIAVPSGSGSSDISTLVTAVAGADLTPPLFGVVNPEGVTTADPGRTYLNTANNSFWVKRTGTGNTGWMQLIG